MVYGRLFYNNLKEYTPNFIRTVPYSITEKPIFRTQVTSNFNQIPFVRSFWNGLYRLSKYNSLWQLFIFANCFIMYYLMVIPARAFYIANNQHRTFCTAMKKETAHQKKLAELEEQEEEE